MISSLLHILTISLFLISSLAQRGMYDGYTTSALIPFLEAGDPGAPFTDPVHVALRLSDVSSKEFKPVVDTGTCGFVISAADIPDWREDEATFDSLGWEFLSSSKRLYNGHWIKRNIFFTSDPQPIL